MGAKADQLAELDSRASQPDFWNDTREAKSVLRSADGLRNELEAWNSLIAKADDLAELSELGDSSAD
ncbi:MAG: PCRF domain-containing protein, partial [Chloroflexota bacterium]